MQVVEGSDDANSALAYASLSGAAAAGRPPPTPRRGSPAVALACSWDTTGRSVVVELGAGRSASVAVLPPGMEPVHASAVAVASDAGWAARLFVLCKGGRVTRFRTLS